MCKEELGCRERLLDGLLTLLLLCRRFMQTFEFEIVFNKINDKIYKHKGISMHMTKTIGSGAEAPIQRELGTKEQRIATLKERTNEQLELIYTTKRVFSTLLYTSSPTRWKRYINKLSH